MTTHRRSSAMKWIAGPILVLTCAAPARAATIRVTSAADAVSDDGNCTLREAVQAVSDGVQVDACVPSGAIDTVVLASARYRLEAGPLVVRRAAKIAGAGAGETVIDASGQSEGFQLAQGDGLLEMSDLTVRGSFGAAIVNAGLARLTRVELRENGVGFLNLGSATVVESTISDNRSIGYLGAGVSNEAGAELRIERSTIANNLLERSMGAGGIGLDQSTVEILDSTIAGNVSDPRSPFAEAANAVFAVSGSVTLRGVTLVDGAGNDWPSIAVAGELTIGNSILSGRCEPGDAAFDVVSEGGSLEGPGDTCGLRGPLDRAGVSPLGLGALSDRGGPTPTIPLLRGSPAIDSARAQLCSRTDQRGVPRPRDGNGDGSARCDRGAFERVR